MAQDVFNMSQVKQYKLSVKLVQHIMCQITLEFGNIFTERHIFLVAISDSKWMTCCVIKDTVSGCILLTAISDTKWMTCCGTEDTASGCMFLTAISDTKWMTCCGTKDAVSS
jgi:hypothetical protein